MSEDLATALADLRAELLLRRGDARLAAAHEAELIGAGEPATAAVRHALVAACEEGCAIGLDTAISLLHRRTEADDEASLRPAKVARSGDPCSPRCGWCLADGEFMDQFPDNGALGTFAHAVIATLLTSGVREPRPADLLHAAAQHPAACRGAIAHRMMVRARLTAAASAYFFNHAPAADWKFLGAEVQLDGGTRVDLLWNTPEGYLIEELKMSRWGEIDDPELAAQIARQLAAGRNAFGDEFIGVRVLHLGAPRAATFIPA